MACAALDDKLDDYIDGHLAPADAAALAAHVEDCTACAARVAREREQRALLAAWGESAAPLPEAAWFDAALERAARDGAAQQPRRWLHLGLAGVGGALAASLALLLITGGPLRTPEPSLPGVTMTVARPQTVNLVFDAKDALPAATVTLLLPAGVELASRPGERRISWSVDLAAGRNLLPLRLVGRQQQTAELEAILTHENDSRRFRVRLSVT